jgi:uncharacterized protein
MSIQAVSYQHDASMLTVLEVEDKGKGVFAQCFIPSGTLVCVGCPIETTSVRTEHSFQVDWECHVELDEPARLINHGCDFNLVIQDNELGGYSFYARRDILKGEELTWHYGMTEAVSIAVRACRCNSAQCEGRSVGFTEMSTLKQGKLHQNGIANYLAKWYIGQSRELSILKAS